MLALNGVAFEPPPGFATDETMVSLRTEPKSPAAPPKGRPTGAPRKALSSLILHTKKARRGKSLAAIAGEFTGELAQSMPAMQSLTTAAFRFDDGEEGVLVAYDFQPPKSEQLRQYQVLRLDGTKLTSLTLTTPVADLTEKQGEVFLKSLASLRLS